MEMVVTSAARRTSADVVFDTLYDQISTLQLLPGAKLSESEVATLFGVSRQPVRDAFARLANHGLLVIRPQKATEVSKFSMAEIERARFVRLSVEVEVVRRAAERWDGTFEAAFDASLAAQKSALSEGDVDRFHEADYDFHRLICDAARADFAFDLVAEYKVRVDRLCMLSLTKGESMEQLVGDHAVLVDSMKQHDTKGATDALRMHLARLDQTVIDIHAEHAQYFEP